MKSLLIVVQGLDCVTGTYATYCHPVIVQMKQPANARAIAFLLGKS